MAVGLLAAVVLGCVGGETSAPEVPGGSVAPAGSTAPAVAPSPPMEPTLTRELRAALGARDFERLEARLADVQRRWAEDHRNEASLSDAFGAFAVPDETLAPHLDAWIAARPSAIAHTARGWYRAKLAFAKRGTNEASGTSAAAFEAYEETGALARADLKEAIVLDAAFPAACWGLVAMEHVPLQERRAFLTSALELDPGSLVARSRYLSYLQPKWGGSLEQIAEVVDEAQQHLEENPKLAALRGYASFVAADAAAMSGDYEEVERLMTEALAHGGLRLYYRTRANARLRLGRLKEAVADCDRGLEIATEDAELLEMRGACYRRQAMPDRALADLDAAIEIDPTRAWAYYERAYIRCKLGQLDAALPDAEQATIHDPTFLGGYEKAGEILIKQGRPAEAVRYLTEAMTLTSHREREDVLFALATARYLSRDEAAWADLDAYVALSTNTSGPRAARLDWARKVLAAGPDARWTFDTSVPP